jgi:hypothetical protein
MTIKRLIEILKTFNEDAEILFAAGITAFGEDDVYDVATIYNGRDLKVWVDLLPKSDGE